MKKTYTFVLALIFVLSLSCENDSSILEINDPITSEVNASKANFNVLDQELNSCNTAFAKGTDSQSTCFIENGFNRWGWTIGPLSGGKYTFDIYAGAGQCDTDKGDLAGFLEVDYNELNGTAEIRYVANSNYSFNETHLYIGNDPYPKVKKGKKTTNTVSPGRFPYKNDTVEEGFSDSYTIEGLSGDIYIIAHSVVCFNPEDDSTDDNNNEDDSADDNNDESGGDGLTDPENNEDVTCGDCQGTVTNLTLRYLASNTVEVKITQSDGEIVFLDIVETNQEISFSGLDTDGSFGNGVEIFINGELDGVYITDCTDFIGPGFPGGSFVVSEGRSSQGGILCPIDIF